MFQGDDIASFWLDAGVLVVKLGDNEKNTGKVREIP